MSGRRVVLLARAGGARERTEAALKQADAELLATFDPATVEAVQIRAGDLPTSGLGLDLTATAQPDGRQADQQADAQSRHGAGVDDGDGD